MTMVHLLRKAVLEGIVSSFGVIISSKFQRTRGAAVLHRTDGAQVTIPPGVPLSEVDRTLAGTPDGI